jgi:hypothetical protein
MLSQLSYGPGQTYFGFALKFRRILVGLGGFEPPTSPLSGVRSNHLSYRPGVVKRPCSPNTSLLPVMARLAEQQTYGRLIPTA